MKYSFVRKNRCLSKIPNKSIQLVKHKIQFKWHVQYIPPLKTKNCTYGISRDHVCLNAQYIDTRYAEKYYMSRKRVNTNLCQYFKYRFHSLYFYNHIFALYSFVSALTLKKSVI